MFRRLFKRPPDPWGVWSVLLSITGAEHVPTKDIGKHRNGQGAMRIVHRLAREREHVQRTNLKFGVAFA